ncbi:MAG: glutamine-hydrolyzing GMP synthase [Piscirickettsiaceae bacterium]|nr:glutamine-hydrolyzing GMP synthase [Piscirickettsiaceae bacterium]
MSDNINNHRILIIDFGSQYTQLIARRVRETGVYCELRDPRISAEEIRIFSPKGIILSGGPHSTVNTEAPAVSQDILTYEVPILGICYGMQTIVKQLGGQVKSSNHREFGHAQIQIQGQSELFKEMEDPTPNKEGHTKLDVWMSHVDKVVSLPDDFQVIASTDSTPLAAIVNEKKKLYGVQFHPEVTHTPQGQQIIKSFVTNICKCDTLWTSSQIIEDHIKTIRTQVGTDNVLLGLSGGVDSSVVAALLHRAIGKQLTCIFIDNGLLRQNEGDQIISMFARYMEIKIIRIDAGQHFFQALANTDEPEAKRKIIGRVFVEVFEKEASKLGNIKWLAQGTIYSDIIESAATKTGKANLIKLHHNVGGLPKDMTLQLLEPLRDLFKDEVRKLGIQIGLPKNIIYRHPFPGPGLGVRILGQVTKKYTDLLRKADQIFIDELHRHNLYNKISQAFAVFLPVKSVGVMGDEHRYDYVISLRAVETIDFMTARWAHLPHEFLGLVSNRIINEIKGISRVTYDISSKPPATIEWE